MAAESKRTIPSKGKTRVKRVLAWTAAGLAALNVGYLGLAKAHVEAPRYLNMLKDPYRNMTLEASAEKIKDWSEARDYMIRHLRFSKGNNNMPEDVHQTRKAVCYGAMFMAKKLLEDNPNYKVTAVEFKSSKNKFFHSIALVKDQRTGKYGSLGINAFDCIKPTYNTPQEVYSKVHRAMLGLIGKPVAEN
ncbi:MAG: hypothetical protein AABW59_02750 [archaeon]